VTTPETERNHTPPAGPGRIDSGLMALSGTERRLAEKDDEQASAEKTGRKDRKKKKKKRPAYLRMGLQGRFTLVVLGFVLLVMIIVAWVELNSGIQMVQYTERTYDFTRLYSFQSKLTAVLFLLRTPIVALVATGFVMLFYASNYIIRPLKNAGTVADAIASGDLTRRIDYEADDEIGDLVSSFNTMTRSLVRKVDQLASLNQAGQAFSSHLSLEKLAATISANVREHVCECIIGLYTVDPEEIEAAGGLESAMTRADSDDEDLSPALLERQRELALRTIESENLCVIYRNDNRIHCTSVWVGDRPVESTGFPLFSAGSAFGALTLTASETVTSLASDDIEFLKTLASHISVAARNAQLYRSLEISYLDTVAALAAAVDAKDAYTRGHSERVMRNAVNLAREVGLDRRELEMIRYSALLHDVGKIGLPTHILSTKEKLTEEEFNLVKQHPTIGYEIVKPISFLRPALDGIRYHHERWDGRGYPAGLQGEGIPFMARLMALADTWDAMAHDRFYRRARSSEEIVQEFRDCSGTQFDPSLVPVAVEVLPRVAAQDGQAQNQEDAHS